MLGLVRQLLLVASLSLLVVGNPLPEVMVPGPLLLQGAAVAPEDQSPRSERSANLSHITGVARKIRIYIKNKYLQLMPDGQVNATNDHQSDYTILQRSSIRAGHVKIQGVASCMHLCMDVCGLLYGSRDFQEECVFNEMIEESNYNSYSSAKYSNQRRTLYLALNRKGLPRRVLVKAKTPLGKLSIYTRALTMPVILTPAEQKRLSVCPPPPPPPADTDFPRCRRRKKKKKRRRCPENSRRPCNVGDDNLSNEEEASGDENKKVIIRRKCEEENCRTKKLHMIGRKRKSRHGAGAVVQTDGQVGGNAHGAVKRTRHLHHLRHRGLQDIEDQEEEVAADNENEDHEENDDPEQQNILNMADGNNDDNDEITTDHMMNLLDTNDKK